MNDNTNIINDARPVCLCSVGQPDYSAVTAMAADRSEHPWLAQRDGIGDHTARYRRTCADIAHEEPGPPQRWAARVALPPFRCGLPQRPATHAASMCPSQATRAVAATPARHELHRRAAGRPRRGHQKSSNDRIHHPAAGADRNRPGLSNRQPSLQIG